MIGMDEMLYWPTYSIDTILGGDSMPSRVKRHALSKLLRVKRSEVLRARFFLYFLLLIVMLRYMECNC
jgi:hypothetical protein